MCYICWASWTTTPGSFGISVSQGDDDESLVAADCTADFVNVSFIPFFVIIARSEKPMQIPRFQMV